MKTFKISLGVNHQNNKSRVNNRNITDNLPKKIKELNEAIKRDSIKNKYHRRQRQRIRGIGKETRITSRSIVMTDKAYDNATKLFLKKKTVNTRLKNKHNISRRGINMDSKLLKIAIVEATAKSKVVVKKKHDSPCMRAFRNLTDEQMDFIINITNMRDED